VNADLCIVAELGNEGWGWKGLQSYYKKVRDCTKAASTLD